MMLGVGPSGPVESSAIHANSSSALRGASHRIEADMNVQAWSIVLRAGKFRHWDWTVKSEPDAVFLPGRLRHHLKSWAWGRAAEVGLYLRNCAASAGDRPQGSGGGSLKGPLEILSRGAAEALVLGVPHCERKLHIDPWGEDLFLQRCLDLLNVSHAYDPKLLSDEQCTGHASSCRSGKIAFHPFRSASAYTHCLREADGDVERDVVRK